MDSVDSSWNEQQAGLGIWLEGRSIQQIPAPQKKKRERENDGQADGSVFKNMISPAGS